MSTFAAAFGGRPEAIGEAPGRVNLLGEHTDYNDGFVLPIATPQRTRVTVRRAAGALFHVHSAVLGRRARFTLESGPAETFARYVHGCVRLVAEQGGDVPPLEVHIASDVPIGVGLSSSAALAVSTLRALRALLDLALDDVAIARMARRVEVEFIGVNVGIMDQMAASLADARHMLFLDTRTLDRRLLPLPAGSAVLVIDSGVPRALTGTRYNERRGECEAAARMLGVAALRDAEGPAFEARIAALPDPLRRRARHVVRENARVLQAAAGVPAAEFGALMNDSHESLRADFEVSIPALDALAAAMRADARIFGARMTGAGFGGACVALCAAGAAHDAGRDIVARHNQAGGKARVLVPRGA